MLQGLCMFNARKKIVLFNQRYADMMNLPGSDLMGPVAAGALSHPQGIGRVQRRPEKPQ
jgi:hypothetical protein